MLDDFAIALGGLYNVADEKVPGHRVFVSPHAFGASLSIRCECGWTLDFSMSEIMWSKDEALEELAMYLDEHLDKARGELNPSLSELGDWGWFSVDS